METEITDIGKVAITPQKDYQNERTYEWLDVVTYDGAGYMCIAEDGCTGIVPTNTDYWQLLADKGHFTEEDKEEFKKAIVEESKTEINEHTDNKKTELNNYTTELEKSLKNEFDTYETEKEEQLDLYKATLETEMANKKDSLIEEIETAQDDFDANVEEKTNTFNSNVETKTTEFNNNSTEKINAFNSNAEEKIADYDEHVETLTSRIADLEEETEDLFNALDTEKISGTELYVEDAKPCRIMNTEIGGMYKQETTTGTQLANFKNVSNIAIVDGTVDLLSKTEGFSAQFNIEETTLTAGNYCFYFLVNKSGNVNTQNLKINENTVGVFNFLAKGYNYCDFTLTEDITCSVLKLWLGAQWCNKTLKEISLIKGTHSDITKYEPYTGGIPSPSPDYPQETEQVESVKLMCNNANLFNITDYTNLNLTQNGSAVITKAENNFNFVTSANNYCGAYFTKEKLKTYIDGCKEDETYTFSFDVIASKATNFRFGTDNIQLKTITTTKQRISVKGTLANTLTFYSMSQEAGTTITISNIKVTKTEDIEYTPYQNQTINVDLKGNKLCAVSDTVKDKLLIDRNGNVALQKNVGYVKYTNKEGWQTNGATEFRYGYITPILKVPAKANEKSFLSNLAIQSNPNNSQTNMVLSGVTSSFKLRVYIPKHFLNTELDQMNAFNELLQKTPMELYYQLATPELIDLGQLPELPKTFSGVNNIWAETNLGNTEIEIEYVQDVKKLLEKQAEQQNARLDNIEALLSTTQTSALLLDNMQNDLESEVE